MKKTEKSSQTPVEPPRSEATPEPSLDGSSEKTPLETSLNAKLLELTSDLQRTRADFENYRKNVEKDKETLKRLTKFSTIEKILPLLDDLDRAILTYPKELKPLEKNFEKTLKSLNLEKLETKSGTEFNPDFHEAVLFEEREDVGEKEIIVETLRSGYKYEGEILRPAMVKVARS